MWWIIGFILFWVVCGVFAYAADLAYSRVICPAAAEMDFEDDRNYAIEIALFGPFGLFYEWRISKFKYGFRWRFRK